MRRLRCWLIGPLALLACLAVLAVTMGADYMPSGRPPADIIVVASDAPGWMRVGGPGRYICKGTNDDVQWQAAIDAAQTYGQDVRPRVVLSPGTFYWANTVYVGYNAAYDTPAASYAPDIIGSGLSTVRWRGSTGVDQWMMKHATKLGSHGCKLEGILFDGYNKASGLHLCGNQYGSHRRLWFFQCPNFGLFAIRAWEQEFDDLRFTGNTGCSAFLGGIVGPVRRLDLSSSIGSTMPPFRRYDLTSASSTLVPFEFCNDGGSKRAYILEKYGAYLYVVHVDADGVPSDSGDFVDTDSLTGETSGGTGVVKISATQPKYDLRAGISVIGSSFSFDQPCLQSCQYTEPAASPSYDNPVLRFTQCANGTLRDLYTEAGTGSPYARKLADTFIQLTNCNRMVLKNVKAWNRSYNLQRTGATSGPVYTPTSMGDWATRIQAGDTVHLWGGTGTLVADDYEVKSVDATTITLTSSPGDDTTVYCHAVTEGLRSAASVAIDMDYCRRCVVKNVRGTSFRTAVVSLDANCQLCELSNVMTEAGLTADGEFADPTLVTEAYWHYHAQPAAIIANLGTRNSVFGAQQINGGSLTYEPMTARDGVELASAANLNISTAWGPAYKVYVTGTTGVAELDGGYFGQVVTLIGTDASGFTIDDDDRAADGASTDLIGTDADVTLEDGEAISLICIVSTSGAQIWVEMGHW